MPTTITSSPKQNRILAALTVNEYARLQDDLESVSLGLGQVLYEPGDSLTHIYFPTTCIVSLIFTTENGLSAELAISGNDGLVGIPLVLDGDITSHRMVVQSAGEAYRLRAEVMRWELDQSGSLRRLALRYAQALISQMAQSVVCNRHHSVEQQLCRWLLLSLDRLPGNQIKMTQELIGNMLGIRREAVMEAARKLQTAGIIQYSRGCITVIDRLGLEARVCECYSLVKSEYARLLQAMPDIRSRNRPRPNPATLRQRAEARLRHVPPKEPRSAWDEAQLLHELEVRQIELEMHNDELTQAYEESDALRERYADIYDFSPVGYFTLNPLGVIVDLNLAGAVLLGIKGSQKGRYRFATYVEPAHRTEFNRFITDVLHAKDKRVGEFKLAENSQRTEATVRIEAVTDESGRECRMVVSDITEAKTAQEALSEHNQYQRALLDNFPFMVWLKDEKSRFLAVNNAFAKVFGWPSTESLIGKTDLDIAPRGLAQAYRADDLMVMRSGLQKNVVEQIETGGERRWFETYKSPVNLDEHRIGTVGFGRDITDRQNNQRALEDSEARYRSFIENLPLTVAITQDGLLKYINPTGVELIGYSAADCIGKSFLPLVFEADRPAVIAAHQQRMDGEPAPSNYMVRIVSNTGRVIDCQMHASNVQWDGRIAALAIFEDVTDYRAMEAELRRLATIDSLTELANRRQFFIRMDEALSRLQRDVDREVAILMCDLDHFKEINDRFGHAAGDVVLRHFSTLLRDELRKVDVAGRVGGEEFAVLLPESDQAAAMVFAERLRKKVAETSVCIEGEPVFITVSIGIAAMLVADETADQGLLRADKALYLAKAAGRNRIALAEVGELAQPDISSRSL